MEFIRFIPENTQVEQFISENTFTTLEALNRMIKFDNFLCKNKFSSLGQTFVLLNCYSVLDRSRVLQRDTSCSELCARNNSNVPTYNEWKTISLEDLRSACTNKDRCDFAISTKFNLSGSYWSSGDHKLEDIIWKSVEYPRLNDILTICGFGAFTSGNFQVSR